MLFKFYLGIYSFFNEYVTLKIEGPLGSFGSAVWNWLGELLAKLAK